MLVSFLASCTFVLESVCWRRRDGGGSKRGGSWLVTPFSQDRNESKPCDRFVRYHDGITKKGVTLTLLDKRLPAPSAESYDICTLTAFPTTPGLSNPTLRANSPLLSKCPLQRTLVGRSCRGFYLTACYPAIPRRRSYQVLEGLPESRDLRLSSSSLKGRARKRLALRPR